jgi:hypothetical protein
MPGFKNDIIGHKVAAVRPMTQSELDDEYWSCHMGNMPVVIELENGTKLYASKDSEGNGPGVLLGCTKNKNKFQLCITGRE